MTAPSPRALAGGRRAALERRVAQRRAGVARLQLNLGAHQRDAEDAAVLRARLAYARRVLRRAELSLAAATPVDTTPRRRVQRLTRSRSAA